MNIHAISSGLAGMNSLVRDAGTTATPLSGTPRTGVNGIQAVTPAEQAAQPQPPPGLTQVQQALDEVRDAISPVAQNLQFSIDDDTGKTLIKVVDASTDEVIRQIPSEEIVAIAKALDKLQGVLIKQQA